MGTFDEALDALARIEASRRRQVERARQTITRTRARQAQDEDLIWEATVHGELES